MTSSLDDDTDLLAEVRRLIEHVETLTQQVAALGGNITISKETSDAAERSLRTSTVLTRVAVSMTILCLILSGGVLYLFKEAHDNSITACHNANESRAGNLAAWQFLIDASAANHPNPTPAQKRITARFQAWINTLYSPHDCNHLGQSYPIPAPPKLK